MIRGLFTLCLLAGFVYFGLTVKLGSRTLFGHAVNIWQAEETQEMVDGVKEKGAPVVEKVARGARAGWQEVTSGDTKPAVGTDAPAPDNAPTPTRPGAGPGPRAQAPHGGSTGNTAPSTTAPATDPPSPDSAKARGGKAGEARPSKPGVMRSRAGAPS